MESKIWHYIEEHGLLAGRHTVGAAVSGGPDSMALLVCLIRLSEKHGFSVSALHYDHGTRNGQSAEDAAFVREFCARRGVPYLQRCGNVAEDARSLGVGSELAGRLAREEFFRDAVRQGFVDAAATAHHLDDNAESIVMHMVRGCGIDGLRGIQPEKDCIIRPMLCVGRGEILEYLDRTGTPFVQDETNSDTSFDRNYVRHVILTGVRERLNPFAAGAMQRLSESASEDADYLSQVSREAYGKCCTAESGKSCTLDCAALNALHPAVAGRVVREALARTGRTYDVERIHVRSVLRAAKEGRTGVRLSLGGGFGAEVRYGTIVLGSVDKPHDPFETKFVLPGCTYLPYGGLISGEFVRQRGCDTDGGMCEYVDADRIPEDAVVRTRRPGDRIRPLGCPGTKKLKDFFIDRKIPRPERDTTPLLASGSDILWVAGSMISDDIAVRGDTSRICRLRFSADGDKNQAGEGLRHLPAGH